MVLRHYRKMRHGLGLRFVPVIATVWLFGFTIAHLWPASWWMQVDRVVVFDGRDDNPIEMAVDRTINRPFAADWTVTVRRVAEGSTTVVCTASGGGSYRPDATLPDPLTLGWWAWGGNCEPLPPGKYLITTSWAIHPPLMPDKRVTVDSNIFEVRECRRNKCE